MSLTLPYCQRKICALLTAVLFSSACLALADQDYQLAKKLRQQGKILSLEKIIANARNEKNGEVLETEFEAKNGRYIYEVEILDSHGQVWEIKLDAKSGKVIKVEIDD